MPAASIVARPEPVVRPATPADAADLARLVDLGERGAGAAVLGRDGRARARTSSRSARGGRRATTAPSPGATRRSPRSTARWPAGWSSYRIGDAPEPLDEAAADRPAARRAGEPRRSAASTSTCWRPMRAFRGRGVATALLRHAARAAGAAALSLIVADGNATARRLYEGFGFVERGAAADRQGRVGERQPGVGADDAAERGGGRIGRFGGEDASWVAAGKENPRRGADEAAASSGAFSQCGSASRAGVKAERPSAAASPALTPAQLAAGEGKGLQIGAAGALHCEEAGSGLPVRGPNPSGLTHS